MDDKNNNNLFLKSYIKRARWQQIICIAIGYIFFSGIGFLARGIEGLVFVIILFSLLLAIAYLIVFIVITILKKKNKL